MAVRFGQSLKMTRRRDLQPYMGLEIAEKGMKKRKSNEWGFIDFQGENLTLNSFHVGFEHVKPLLRTTCLRNHPNLSRLVRVEQAHQILTWVGQTIFHFNQNLTKSWVVIILIGNESLIIKYWISFLYK